MDFDGLAVLAALNAPVPKLAPVTRQVRNIRNMRNMVGGIRRRACF